MWLYTERRKVLTFNNNHFCSLQSTDTSFSYINKHADTEFKWVLQVPRQCRFVLYVQWMIFLKNVFFNLSDWKCVICVLKLHFKWFFLERESRKKGKIKRWHTSYMLESVTIPLSVQPIVKQNIKISLCALNFYFHLLSHLEYSICQKKRQKKIHFKRAKIYKNKWTTFICVIQANSFLYSYNIVAFTIFRRFKRIFWLNLLQHIHIKN